MGQFEIILSGQTMIQVLYLIHAKANKQQKNWFGRNWKWAVPSLGCLIIIVFAIFLAGAMVVKVTGLFKESVPYSDGMAALKSNELVIEEIGEPIEPNGMFQGNVSLRKKGEKLDYDQDMINEIIKCSQDIIYFAENMV